MREPLGDMAIVLHSHMPYVEGFGTYPFGEEWLFDAVIRSYLPVLDIADGVTMSVTPVLADQLEDRGVRERLREFLLRFRIDSAELDARDVGPELKPAAEAEAARYRHALELLDGCDGDVLNAFREGERQGRVTLAASTATHAVLPLLATPQAVALQLDAGIRSHRRRFGWSGGFWLPECAYGPGLERSLAEHGVRWLCVDQSGHENGLAALSPVATADGPVAFTIEWEAVSWLWSLDGYPSDAAHAQFEGKSLRGVRLWGIDGQPYDPERAAHAAERQAGEFLEAVRSRLGDFARERGRPGLITFAIDTELLGHWWSEGPVWLAAVIRGAAESGVRLVTLPQALDRHEPEPRQLRASSWGDGKDLRTWDGGAVADLTWAARRLELRLLRALGQGLDGTAALRATRELLALQASDWAFLDNRRQAGDYAFQRMLGHSEAMLQAIHSRRPPDARMRSLAPDLRLSPLLEP